MKANNHSKMHILLIEDNQDHAELIMKSLSKSLSKAIFTHCSKQQECIKLVQRRKFDLILMDFYIAGNPCLELLKSLKKVQAHIPVIIITGQGDEKTAAKSIKAGAEEYVEKTRESLESLPKTILKILSHTSGKSKKPLKKARLKTNSTSHLKNVFEEFEHISTSLRSLYERLNGKTNKKPPRRDLKKIPLLEKKVSGLKSLMMKLFSGRE